MVVLWGVIVIMLLLVVLLMFFVVVQIYGFLIVVIEGNVCIEDDIILFYLGFGCGEFVMVGELNVVGQ